MLALLAAAALAPAPVAPPPPQDPHRPKIEAGYRLVAAGDAQAALAAIEPVIADFENQNAKRKARVYCGMSMTETLAYMAIAAGDKKGAIALGTEFCDALYLKGYALIDLKRLPEARETLRYLLTFAPNHAHFWTELGQSYRFDSDWPKMLETCTTAESYTDIADSDTVNREKGLAWRCMGYALIEQGKWDEAEALYRKCLAVDPKNAKAQNELNYIAEQRAKPKT